MNIEQLNIEQLNQDFKRLNVLNEKNSFDRIKFCWKLIKSDDNNYIETHLEFLERANKHFNQDLLDQFRYRKDKEKVYQYLQKKLKENISEKLKENISQIIENFNFKTLDEYQNWISEIKSNKRDDKMDFIFSIMKSSYVEYHYNLLKDEMLDDNFKRDLGFRFNEHKESGAVFLLDKLKNSIDIDFQGKIIFMLGRLAEYNKKETLKYARNLTNSKDDFTRDRALIVLGWIGGAKEYSILKDRLLNDLNTNCRAWSASSFMQMWFNRKSKGLREFTLNTYKEALEKESNYFVISTIIESIREIENKNLVYYKRV